MKRWILMLGVGAMVLAAPGCVNRAGQEQAKLTEKIVSDPVKDVSVAEAKVVPIANNLEITGNLTTSEDVQIGAKSPGRIVAVYVQDGSSVTAGQLLASQDTTQLMAQVNQANASVQSSQSALLSAQSTLAQAIQNARVNPSKTSAAVRSAEASLRSAKAQLQKMLAGARPEERAQSEASVKSAKQNLDSAQKELERVRTLVSEGAIPGSRLDSQQAATASAQAAYDVALQGLTLIQNGNRAEDIATARANVQTAQEALSTAKSTKELDSIYGDQVNGARAQVATAQAQISSAQSQVTIANQALSDAQIKAPFSGKVSGKPVQAGTVLGSGGTVLRLIGSQGVYLDGNVPQESVTLVTPGKPVSVKIEGSDRVISGHVQTVNPLGETVGRQFKARIQLDGPTADLRPGMFARANIQLNLVQATVVPTVALLGDSDKRHVMVMDGDKAKTVNVTTGLSKDLITQVTGLAAGAQVIVQGQADLTDGAKVRVKPASKVAETTSKPSGG